MTTTNEVRTAFESLSTAEIETSDLSNGVRVALSEDEIGRFYGIVRRNGFDANAKRLGDTLVAHIEAEKSGGLGDLFG